MTANNMVDMIREAFDEGDAATMRHWAESLRAHIATGRGRPYGMGYKAALDFAASAVTFARTIEQIARDDFAEDAEALSN